MSEIFTPQNGQEPNNDRPALVLDTNTVLALWMFRDPALNALRKWIEAGNCILYSREDALEELRRVLAYRQFGLDMEAQIELHDVYNSRLSIAESPQGAHPQQICSHLPRCTDPDDQKFLEIAYLSKASHILTRDRALLGMARRVLRCHSLSILTPERFPQYRTNPPTEVAILNCPLSTPPHASGGRRSQQS